VLCRRVLLAALAASGCAYLPIPMTYSRGSRPVGGDAPNAAPVAVVILPPSADVYLSSKSGGRRGEEESRSAAVRVLEALRTRFQDAWFELRDLPVLSDAELDRVQEHVGLCGVVAPLFVTRKPISGVEHTLGPGLAFLSESTGADAALIANGREVGNGLDGENGPSAGLGLSLVDLRTGRLLWVAQIASYNRFSPPSLRSEEDVVGLVERVLREYPPASAAGKAAHR